MEIGFSAPLRDSFVLYRLCAYLKCVWIYEGEVLKPNANKSALGSNQMLQPNANTPVTFRVWMHLRQVTVVCRLCAMCCILWNLKVQSVGQSRSQRKSLSSTSQVRLLKAVLCASVWARQQTTRSYKSREWKFVAFIACFLRKKVEGHR